MDESGSTGVIALYDGARHVFTVAGVGDSMCVLCRSGRAVVLNKMHRLNDNEDEKQRIIRAGGIIKSNRYERRNESMSNTASRWRTALRGSILSNQ